MDDDLTAPGEIHAFSSRAPRADGAAPPPGSARRALLALALTPLILLAPGTSRASDYKLGPLDRLQIKVHEWPALTDVLSVSPEGDITLPLVGTIHAAGMSVADLAREISNRVQDYGNRDQPTFASVEVVQFRPFYVAGDVQRPGEYPFRPGLTVLMALSLSGGVYRGPVEFPQPVRDRIAADGAVAAAKARKDRLDVKLRVLAADQTGEDLSSPAINALRARAPDPTIVDSEIAIVRERRRLYDDQVSALRKRIDIYRDQIREIRLQIESATHQRASVEREMAGQQGLVDKGLALTPRIATLERLAAQIEGDQRGLETSITRAQDSIASLEGEIQKLANERAARGRSETAETSRELEDAKLQIAVQRRLADEASSRTALQDETRRPPRVEFRVARRVDGAKRTFPVDDDFVLDAGDVVLVDKKLDPAPAATALAAP